ncbi:response regulator [Lysobacter sp. FW306-1B-D06B]|uniref:response regulator transcription factor n=1 Tax=Lysobacter sp. FW306-1B-D06B TaxID=3140250 RepID=UPI00313FE15D
MEAKLDSLAKLIAAAASFAWPVVFAVLLYKLYEPIRNLVDSARGRKFSIKVAGNELSMEEASEQQRQVMSDVQAKLAELEQRLAASPVPVAAAAPAPQPLTTGKRILWVDDNPRNNSFLIASLQDRGATVDTALTTQDALRQLQRSQYDIVISDMGRPEGDRAGIELAQKLKTNGVTTPVYIFCGAWAAKHWRGEALAAGVAEITSSGTTLLSVLPLE